MKKHEITTADSTAVTKADTAPARTLADFETTPRVITPEEEEVLDSVAVSPIASVYLRAFVVTGNNIAACRIVGIDPSTPRKWKERDHHFAAIWADLKEEVVERWNAVAEHRALQGFEERSYDKGRSPAWRAPTGAASAAPFSFLGGGTLAPTPNSACKIGTRRIIYS